MAWLYLYLGVGLSILGNALVKQSNGFTDVKLGVASFILFGVGIYLYSLAVKSIPIGTAYAVWSGIGVLSIAIIGIVWFKEPIGTLNAVFIAMILAGCIGLNLMTKA